MNCQFVLTLITTLLETACYAGVVYGWASINPVLVREGYFREKCSPTVVSCVEQAETLNLVFAITSSIAPILNFFTGIVLDKTGSWLTRTLLILLSSGGFLLTAIAQPGSTSWILFISFPLIGFGGYGLLTVNIQTGNLVPKYRASVAAAVSGAFDSATMVFLAVSAVYNSTGIPFDSIFYFFAAFSVLLHLRTFFLTPKRPTPYILPDNYVYGYKEFRCCKPALSAGNDHHKELPYNNVEDEVVENPDVKSLSSCLREIYTWTNIAHFFTIQFSLIYFIGIFNSWIPTKVVDTELFTTVFGFFLGFGGIVFAPMGGRLIDICRKRFARNLLPDLATLKAVATTQLVGDSFIILTMTFSLIASEKLQYATFVFLVAGRAFLYGTMAAFVSVSYPSQHFGVIYGLTTLIGGVVLLLQYPVTLLVSRVLYGNFIILYSVLLGLCVLATAHPIYMLIYVNKMSKKQSTAAEKSETLAQTRF